MIAFCTWYESPRLGSAVLGDPRGRLTGSGRELFGFRRTFANVPKECLTTSLWLSNHRYTSNIALYADELDL